MSNTMTNANREAQRKFRSNMTPEGRKAYDRERYQKYKSTYRRSSVEWAKKHPEASQAAAHNRSVLVRYPGAVTDLSPSNAVLRKWLEDNRGAMCPYCGEPAGSIDHKVPLGSGGKHEFDNMELICNWCNISKLNRTVEEFKEWIRKLVELSTKKIV